jgi:hypothetical protein
MGIKFTGTGTYFRIKMTGPSIRKQITPLTGTYMKLNVRSTGKDR